MELFRRLANYHSLCLIVIIPSSKLQLFVLMRNLAVPNFSVKLSRSFENEDVLPLFTSTSTLSYIDDEARKMLDKWLLSALVRFADLICPQKRSFNPTTARIRSGERSKSEGCDSSTRMHSTEPKSPWGGPPLMH